MYAEYKDVSVTSGLDAPALRWTGSAHLSSLAVIDAIGQLLSVTNGCPHLHCAQRSLEEAYSNLIRISIEYFDPIDGSQA